MTFNGTLLTIMFILLITLIGVILFYKGGLIKMVLRKRKKKKELETPPEVETPAEKPKPTPILRPGEAQPKADPIEELRQQIQQQKDADLDYYDKLYNETYTATEFKAEDSDVVEMCNLLFGVLAEVKTLNYQLAQVIKEGLLIKK